MLIFFEYMQVWWTSSLKPTFLQPSNDMILFNLLSSFNIYLIIFEGKTNWNSLDIMTNIFDQIFVVIQNFDNIIILRILILWIYHMIHKIDNIDFDISNLNNINDIDNINDMIFDKDVNTFIMMNSILFWYLGGGKMNNDKKKICKLFYRMDMFYLTMNKKPTFYLKRWALAGGLAYIYIYVYVCVSFCSPKMISWTRSSMRTPIFWAMQRTFLVWMYESMVFQCSLNPLHTRSKVQKNNLDAGTTLLSNTFWYTISIYQYNMNMISFWCAC